MNPVRKLIHWVAEKSGIDTRIDPDFVNGWIERLRQRKTNIISVDEGNTWLRNSLMDEKAFMSGKLGSSECWALTWHLGLRRFYKYTWQVPTFGDLDLTEQSGVFPHTPEAFHEFATAFISAVKSLDMVAVWFNIGEHQVLKQFSPWAVRTEICGLEPWFAKGIPWTNALRGRRVLVIHPFEETIRNQYERRSKIWRGRPDILPQFQLRTLRSPYGFSRTDYPNWLAMLAAMESEMDRINKGEGFDVALIGCGAAGLPLAAKAKAMGKVGIHLGGPLQLLFGIRGKRWDSRPEFQSYFNENWCRADESETPLEFSTVDQGGYW